MDRVDAKIESVCAGLTEHGWAIVPDFLDGGICQDLVANIRTLQQQGLMHPAGIGRGEQLQVDASVRSDLIYWIDETKLTPPQELALSHLHALQHALNRSLFLGLRSIEAHLTLYRPGGAYAKHVDNFQGTSARVLSCIIYLTPDYHHADGGQLRLYQAETAAGVAANIADNIAANIEVEIDPRGGTLACFLSETVPHEVLTSHRERYSLTAWFRR